MKQDVWRGMPYYDVFWHKRHLTRRELHAITASYQSYIYWFLVVAIFMLLDLHQFAARVSPFALLIYTVSLLVITMAVYLTATALGMWLSRKYSRFFLLYPVVGIVGVTIATYVTEAGMSSVYGGGMSLAHAAEKLPVNILLSLLLETLYINFALPAVVSGMKDKPDADMAEHTKPACASLTIAGTKFDCKDVIAASAQDHYVSIRTVQGNTLVRARLGDLTGQLNCQNGIQPHRSHWVARCAVVDMVSGQGHKWLVLVDGTRIPVARGRHAEVQRWLDT